MTAPVGSISSAVENLRLLIADTAAFRNWIAEGKTPVDLGPTGQASALARVWRDATPVTDRGAESHTLEEMREYRPYAMVWTRGWKKTRYAEGARRDSGMLGLKFVEDVDAAIAGDEQEIGTRFENTVGSIVDGMDALSETGPYLIINDIEMVSPYMRSSREDAHSFGDVVWVDFRVTWGVP